MPDFNSNFLQLLVLSPDISQIWRKFSLKQKNGARGRRLRNVMKMAD